MDDRARKDWNDDQGVIIVWHVALPRKGHLNAAVHDMAHVGQRWNSRLVYDISYPEIDHSVFKKCD